MAVLCIIGILFYFVFYFIVFLPALCVALEIPDVRVLRLSEVIEQGSGTPGIPRGDARQHVSMIGQHDHRGWGRQPIPSGKASSLPAQVKGSSISEKVTNKTNVTEDLVLQALSCYTP